jgi:hypothetical protein
LNNAQRMMKTKELKRMESNNNVDEKSNNEQNKLTTMSNNEHK